METLKRNLLDEFTKNYFEKLFYFCLKKTGDSFEAEELAADIALNIVTAIQRGTIPVNFSAWVWQIARNRYSDWAAYKRKRRQSDSGADISEMELADSAMSIEGELVHNEDLALLRRELAFITSEYRQIIVAYYIEDRSVRDIATSLKLPEGTIKSKLFRARETLKEGMHMAREFGALSYRPEMVRYVKSGKFSKFNEPECYINRKLCNNIMLAAYRNPSTAEELAVEVGVAVPYMEDELKQLVDATLMRKNGKKYETNFYIISAVAQEKINAHLRGIAPEVTDTVIGMLEHFLKSNEENDGIWHEGYQSLEDMKWAFLMHIVRGAEFNMGVKKNTEADLKKQENADCECSKPTENGGGKRKISKGGYTVRPNDGEWDMMGYEQYDGDAPEFVGLHGCGDIPNELRTTVEWGQYKFNYKRIAWETVPSISWTELEVLIKLAKKEAVEGKEETLERLEKWGFAVKENDTYRPAFWVSFKDKATVFSEEQRNKYLEMAVRLNALASRHYQFCTEVVRSEVPEFLQDDEYLIDFACQTVCVLRGAVIEEALRRGYIKYEEGGDHRMLGVFLTL